MNYRNSVVGYILIVDQDEKLFYPNPTRNVILYRIFLVLIVYRTDSSAHWMYVCIVVVAPD